MHKIRTTSNWEYMVHSYRSYYIRIYMIKSTDINALFYVKGNKGKSKSLI